MYTGSPMVFFLILATLVVSTQCYLLLPPPPMPLSSRLSTVTVTVTVSVRSGCLFCFVFSFFTHSRATLSHFWTLLDTSEHF
jgi:hypothetical protein